MFEFVQPLWMLAASGIIIPVLIHLWNVREGKTLKIGSVSLLVQSSRQAARSFRLREIPLLVLRCLVILLLSTLMAEPYWLQTRKPTQQKGWILLEKTSSREVYARFRTQIDSLAKAGFQLHYFENGFPLTNMENIQTAQDSGYTTSSYWTLLQTLHRQVPLNMPVYLYTGNRLNRFTGNRPQLVMNLHWQTYTPADSLSAWLVSAQLTSSDSIKITKAACRPEALEYTNEYIAATRAAQSGYTLDFGHGKLLLSSAGSLNSSPVEVDTAAMRMMIYTDRYGSDAAYLQAAIRAVQQYSNRRIQVQLTSRAGNMPLGYDWLFWLSDKPLPPSIACSNIFLYTTGKQQQMHSWMMQHDVESSAEPIAVYKTIADTANTGTAEVIWDDGFGYPLLTKRMENNKAVFSFYSRFNPQWNDLPWSSRFPVWLLQILLPEQQDESLGYKDKRTIDEQQLAPFITQAGNTATAKDEVQKTGLSKALWVAAFITLLLERIISFRNKHVKPA